MRGGGPTAGGRDFIAVALNFADAARPLPL